MSTLYKHGFATWMGILVSTIVCSIVCSSCGPSVHRTSQGTLKNMQEHDVRVLCDRGGRLLLTWGTACAEFKQGASGSGVQYPSGVLAMTIDDELLVVVQPQRDAVFQFLQKHPDLRFQIQTAPINEPLE